MPNAPLDASLDIDTVVAIATPPGRGGIGVLRLSGPDSIRIAAVLVQTRRPPARALARYGRILDDTGHRIDDALVTLFPAPHSYTGEDVVEISTHGSPVVLQWLLNASLQHGARLARAGEFTERAFLGGRIDLTEAEAVRDLIDAQTLTQAKLAAEQMGGSLSAQVRPVKQDLVALIATLEAGIDFAEDDIDTLPFAVVETRIHALQAPLNILLSTFRYGRILRDGLRLAIVGPPNAGKSSLFNRLVERDRAIVTATPGTTRDVISERISIGGIPVELLDTAGLRDTNEEIERIGIARSHEAIAEADLILLVTDARTPDPGPPEPVTREPGQSGTPEPALSLTKSLVSEAWNHNPNLAKLLSDRPFLRVHNKIDLLSRSDRAHTQTDEKENTTPSIGTSALTGQGIADLRTAILDVISGQRSGAALAANSAVLTNIRQHDAIARSAAALTRAEQAAQQRTPHEMLLLDLYEALRALDELTGQTTGDDVLNLIFSTFCIGK